MGHSWATHLPASLSQVCDKHGYVGDLAEYLYKNSLLKYIEVYVTKVSSWTLLDAFWEHFRWF